MIDLSILSKEEYEKICFVIPHKYIVNYFQRNPKEFSKIHPGFRAFAVQNRDAIKLLVKFRERGFISSFVQKVVNDWLKEIQDVVQDYQDNGESEITSYVHALYQSFFSDNVSAYFKILKKDYNSDQLDMISSLVLLLKNIEDKQHELEATTDRLENELSNCNKTLQEKEKKIKAINQRTEQLTSELNKLKSIEKQYHELLESFDQVTRENEVTKQQIIALKNEVLSLNNTIMSLQKEKEDLECSIRTRIEEETKNEARCMSSSIPLIPKNLDEFKEYLSYNLESVGVSNDPLPIRTLLVSYLSSVLFQGKPIICNKCFIDVLAKCISNTLAGDAPVSIISFSSTIDEKEICNAINNSGRIVVLENFLGNYNETVLASILDRFKSKIIFLTVSYEKTLYYLPRDFMAFSNYISLSHASYLLFSAESDEDPSTIDEEASQSMTPPKNRHKDVIQKIASELGFSGLLSEMVSAYVYDDISASAVLVFNLLPYMSEVLGKNAFNVSESLQRYAVRSPYKKVFEEWFMV